MFDFLVTFRRDGFTFREVIVADSETEAKRLFQQVHPNLIILSVKIITD